MGHCAVDGDMLIQSFVDALISGVVGIITLTIIVYTYNKMI